MTAYIIELSNVLVTYIPSLLIALFPMWKTRNVKSRYVYIYIGAFTIVAGAGLFITKQLFTLDLPVLQTFKLYLGLTIVPLGFWVYHKRVWQNIFLWVLQAMYQPIFTGIGNYAAENYFLLWAHPLLPATIVSLLISGLTLPLLMYILRRLFNNPYTKDAGVLWRIFWILPAAFFWMTMQIGNPFDPASFTGVQFFIIRGLIFAALLVTCYLLDTSLWRLAENITLLEHTRMIERQLDLQREQYERITINAEAEKNMRHDLRHHLVVLDQLAQAGNIAELKGYVEDLANQTAARQERTYCKNYTANAVAAHYLGIAESEGIKVEATLKVPVDTGVVPAMDICVILGNFLENAVEASRRIERGDKFIRVRSRIDDDTLSIVVTNSFNGVWREENGAYISCKDGEGQREGTGLSSVKAICEKHRGIAQYEITRDVWKSSALVHMAEK